MGKEPPPGWKLSSGKMGLYYKDTPNGTLYGDWSSNHTGSFYIEDKRGNDIGYIDSKGNFRDKDFNLK